jgi:hypothetical protein
VPFPGGRSADPHLHEIALYDAWLEPIVTAALAGDGRLSAAHAEMLKQRHEEGNQPLWAAAGEAGDAARSHVARLLRIEEALAALPLD